MFFYIAGGQIFKIGIQVVSGAIIARLLGPTDFGLLAMVTILTGLLSRVKDGGLSVLAIQADDFSDEKYGLYYWTSVLAGAASGVICIIGGYLLSEIYSEPRLLGICNVTAAVYLIGGFIVQPDAALRRAIKFDFIARLDVLSAAVAAVLVVGMALLGYGYWSVVIGQTLALLVHAVILNSLVARPIKNIPTAVACFGVFRKGVVLMRSNVGAHFSTSSLPATVGFSLGAEILGSFNRLSSVASLPALQIAPQFFSFGFSKLSSIERGFSKDGSFSGDYLIVGSCFAGVSSILLAAYGDFAVTALLGRQWLNQMPIFYGAIAVAYAEIVALYVSSVLLAKKDNEFVARLRTIELTLILCFCAVLLVRPDSQNLIWVMWLVGVMRSTTWIAAAIKILNGGTILVIHHVVSLFIIGAIALFSQNTVEFEILNASHGWWKNGLAWLGIISIVGAPQSLRTFNRAIKSMKG